MPQIRLLPNFLLPVASSHFVAFLLGVLLGTPVRAVAVFGAIMFGFFGFVSHIGEMNVTKDSVMAGAIAPSSGSP